MASEAPVAVTEKKKFFNRNFLLFLQAGFLSYFGDIVYNLAISYWILQTTGSTALMGTAAAVSFLPRIVISPFAGALVDRFDRKQILCLATLFRAVFMSLVALLAFRNLLSIPLVMLSALLLSSAGSFAGPAVSSIIPDLVEKEDVVRANSIRSAAFSFVDLAGNGISGFMVSLLGVPLLIAINAVSFFYYFISLLFLRLPQHLLSEAAKTKNVLTDLKEGVRVFYQNVGLRITLIIFMLTNLFTAGIFSLLLAMFLQRGFSVEQYGIIMACMGMGGLIGMFIVASFRFPSRLYPSLVLFGFILMGSCMILMVCTYNIYLTCAMIGFGMIGNAVANSILNSVFMVGVEPTQRGKLAGVMTTMSNSLCPVSSLIYGFLGEIYPLSNLFIIGMLLGCGSLSLIFLSAQVRDFISLKPAVPVKSETGG
ncbi:MAG: MFS transporter [Negativicutes bacterium]|nr:MFS transporter [Negativicutes bacterium]